MKVREVASSMKLNLESGQPQVVTKPASFDPEPSYDAIAREVIDLDSGEVLAINVTFRDAQRYFGESMLERIS